MAGATRAAALDLLTELATIPPASLADPNNSELGGRWIRALLSALESIRASLPGTVPNGARPKGRTDGHCQQLAIHLCATWTVQRPALAAASPPALAYALGLLGELGSKVAEPGSELCRVYLEHVSDLGEFEPRFIADGAPCAGAIVHACETGLRWLGARMARPAGVLLWVDSTADGADDDDDVEVEEELPADSNAAEAEAYTAAADALASLLRILGGLGPKVADKSAEAPQQQLPALPPWIGLGALGSAVGAKLAGLGPACAATWPLGAALAVLCPAAARAEASQAVGGLLSAAHDPSNGPRARAVYASCAAHIATVGAAALSDDAVLLA